LFTRQLHRDFTFIHPETWVSDRCKLTTNAIELSNKVNTQSFEVLVLPGGKVISLEALKKIKDWYDQGGKLIATSMLPSQSAEFGKDQEVVALIQEMFGSNPSATNSVKKNAKGGQLVFIPKPDAENLSEAFTQMGVAADLIFESLPKLNDDKTEVSYIHKIKDNRNIWYIANSSDTPVKTFVELRGKLNPEFWNPSTGKILPITDVVSVKHGNQVYSRFLLDLPAVKSVFVVGE